MAIHVLRAGLLTLLLVSSSSLAISDKEFACKVQTVGLRLGVVFVQADNADTAKLLASRRLATSMDGGEEGVQSVLRCITYPGQIFPDRSFQSFIEGMPR